MNKWIVAITVMLPTLIEIVDTSVVNVSLDHIRGSLSAGIDESTWTITSYLVSNAIIIPISQAILLETFPPQEHGMAMAIFGIGTMFGPIIGPLMGGWITDNWSWHWIFYINVPIGIISILMTLLFIIDPPYMQRRKIRID